MLSEETYDDCIRLFELARSSERLDGLNAIVLLGLKKCGRATKGFVRLSDEKFEAIVKKAFDDGIGIGFDSCSANKFIGAVSSIYGEKIKSARAEGGTTIWYKNFEKRLNEVDAISFYNRELQTIISMAEPCESALMSAFVDVDGFFLPCSFYEGSDRVDMSFWNGWDMAGPRPFRELWEGASPTIEEFRASVLGKNRSCPIYDV
jgi:hypothetical protein